MNRPEQANEPSMDEILASIRRIIAEDPGSTPPAGPAQVVSANARMDAAMRPSAPLAPVGMKPRLDAAPPARSGPPPLPAAAPSPARDLAADDDILDLVDAPAPPPAPAAPAQRAETPAAGPALAARPLTPRPLPTRPELSTQPAPRSPSAALNGTAPTGTSAASPAGLTPSRAAPPPLPRTGSETANGRTPLRLDAPPLPPLFSDPSRARPQLPTARTDTPTAAAPSTVDIGSIVPRRESEAGAGEPERRPIAQAPLGSAGTLKAAAPEAARPAMPAPSARPGLGDMRRDVMASAPARPLDATKPAIAPEKPAEAKSNLTDKAGAAPAATTRPFGSPPAPADSKLETPIRPAIETAAKLVSDLASDDDIVPPRFGTLFREPPASDLPSSLRPRAAFGAKAEEAAKPSTPSAAEPVARGKEVGAELKDSVLPKVRVAAPAVDMKLPDASVASAVKPADGPVPADAKAAAPSAEAVIHLPALEKSIAGPAPAAPLAPGKPESSLSKSLGDATPQAKKPEPPSLSPSVALVPSPSNAVAPGVTTRSLEDAVSDLLRPMLRSWLDDNMPRIIEKIAREELAKPLGTPATGEANTDSKKKPN